MTPPEGHVAFGLSKMKAPGRDVLFARPSKYDKNSKNAKRLLLLFALDLPAFNQF